MIQEAFGEEEFDFTAEDDAGDWITDNELRCRDQRDWAEKRLLALERGLSYARFKRMIFDHFPQTQYLFSTLHVQIRRQLIREFDNGNNVMES